MGKKIIYLVTEGEYDDYTVKCAFDDLESAKQAVRDGIGKDWEQHVLYTKDTKPTSQDVTTSIVYVGDGKVTDGSTWSFERWDYEDEEFSAVGEVRVENHGYAGTIRVWCQGTDKGAVVVAVENKVREILSEQKITD